MSTAWLFLFQHLVKPRDGSFRVVGGAVVVVRELDLTTENRDLPVAVVDWAVLLEPVGFDLPQRVPVLEDEC